MKLSETKVAGTARRATEEKFKQYHSIMEAKVTDEQAKPLVNLNDSLLNYSSELGLSSPMTIDEFVESHKRIRAMILRYREKDNKVIENQRLIAIGNLHADNEFINIDKLRSMTIAELADSITEN